MGAWGHGLFQSDADLDVADDISDQAGRLANDPDFTLLYPEKRDQVVHKLNAGIFHQLLEKFQAKNWKHGIIYLGALSMQLGVKIVDEDMLVLKKTLPRVTMYDLAKEQMRKGLEGYKNNGEAWDFESPGVVETMAGSKSENGELFYELGDYALADGSVHKAVTSASSMSIRTFPACRRRCRKMEKWSRMRGRWERRREMEGSRRSLREKMRWAIRRSLRLGSCSSQFPCALRSI